MRRRAYVSVGSKLTTIMVMNPRGQRGFIKPRERGSIDRGDMSKRDVPPALNAGGNQPRMKQTSKRSLAYDAANVERTGLIKEIRGLRCTRSRRFETRMGTVAPKLHP